MERAIRRNLAGPEMENARKLLSLEDLVKDNGAYPQELEKCLAYRQKVAQSIVSLKKALEGGPK